MVNYDLDHLTQPDHQRVVGPIQDDEALFLYSIIRGMRLSRILEFGGLDGYSARNFIKAAESIPYNNENYKVYTVDIQKVPSQGDETHHKVITKDAKDLTNEDLDNKPIEFVFFDCHDMSQLNVYYLLKSKNIITDETVIGLHDTNLHFPQFTGKFMTGKPDEPYPHQSVERIMVNTFKSLGYDCFSLHTTHEKHSREFPCRHGVTICQKFKPMYVPDNWGSFTRVFSSWQ